MPQKKYRITLTDDEREQLEQLLHSGTHATRKEQSSSIQHVAVTLGKPESH